jgi:transcriptional regulator with XRE-family HTH domain
MAAGQSSGLNWKLRRVAAGLRQQDIASLAGMSTTRYSAFERGEKIPSDLDRRLIEAVLPSLNVVDTFKSEEGKENE